MNEAEGMNQADEMTYVDGACAAVREQLPDFAARRLDGSKRAPVAAHVLECETCRDELELVGLLLGSRVSAPAGLDERVVEAITRRARPAHRPWWGLSAAAVAAIALGIGISSDGASPTSPPEAIATEFEEGEFWVSDDGMLAGAPSFEDLSDEALMEFLEELTSETSGGAA